MLQELTTVTDAKTKTLYAGDVLVARDVIDTILTIANRTVFGKTDDEINSFFQVSVLLFVSAFCLKDLR